MQYHNHKTCSFCIKAKYVTKQHNNDTNYLVLQVFVWYKPKQLSLCHYVFNKVFTEYEHCSTEIISENCESYQNCIISWNNCTVCFWPNWAALLLGDEITFTVQCNLIFTFLLFGYSLIDSSLVRYWPYLPRHPCPEDSRSTLFIEQLFREIDCFCWNSMSHQRRGFAISPCLFI